MAEKLLSEVKATSYLIEKQISKEKVISFKA